MPERVPPISAKSLVETLTGIMQRLLDEARIMEQVADQVEYCGVQTEENLVSENAKLRAVNENLRHENNTLRKELRTGIAAERVRSRKYAEKRLLFRITRQMNNFIAQHDARVAPKARDTNNES